MKIPLCLLLCAAMLQSAAQDDEATHFPTVTPAMLGVRNYAIDSGAADVILAEYSDTKVNGSNEGGFEIQTRVRRRIHLLKNASFDRASVILDLYTNG